MAVYYFRDKFDASRGPSEEWQIEHLRRIIPGCISVAKTDPRTDRSGIDYVATLVGGAVRTIDGKHREFPCSQHWRNGPEVALEIWSKMPGGCFARPPDRARIGWTRDQSVQRDYILFSYLPTDTPDFFLVPFDLLRMAFEYRRERWMREYRVAIQKTIVEETGDRWESQCVFVPERVMFEALHDVSRGTLILRDSSQPQQMTLEDALNDIPF